MSSRRRLAGLVAAAAAIVLPSVARATPSRTIDTAVNLGADAPAFYDAFTVKSTGVVTVRPFTAGSISSTGWLTIKANTITIEAGGVITADGAGYAGQDGKPGTCQLAISTPTPCAGPGSMAGYPGGGGAFFGNGAGGAIESMTGTCTDLGAQAPGGVLFFSMAGQTLDPGSAGGAGNLATPTLTAGARGGGGIRLVAAVVTIDGTVSAAGASANAFGGVGPGGGSGGAIEITASSLKGSGTLSVKGGDGAHGSGIPGSFAANDGGGGSGGVVLLHLPAGASSPVNVVTDGGKTGTCATLGGGAGGMVLDPLASPCVDADGDGHASIACPASPGDDCDDSDPAVHPGAPEICNGHSDNCGPVDAAPNDCTAKGEVCGAISGVPACVPPPIAGSDAGPSDPPQYIQYGGGCAVRPPQTSPIALLLAGLALAARRRLTRRSTSAPSARG